MTFTTVSSKVAADVAGISYRQLDYWARTGVVEPSVSAAGSGSSRGYSPADVIALRIVNSLEVLGIDLEVCRRVISDVRDSLERDVSRGILVVSCLGAEILFSAEELAQRLLDLPSAASVMPLWSLVDHLDADVVAVERRHHSARNMVSRGGYGHRPWPTTSPLDEPGPR